ncbi:MAG: disulfide bond formation protein B [Planctomycetales bacterium]|nr:disulfide bond formation protein B [Planctomycetales bacterium]
MSSSTTSTCPNQLAPRSAAGGNPALGWARVALLLAFVGTAGSLYLSLGMGLKACPLCFYQRTFAMVVLATLGIGLVVEPGRAGFLCLLSLPSAVAGLGVAAFHEYLVLTNVLECPQALLGFGTAPVQSLTLFATLAIIVSAGARSGRAESSRQSTTMLASAFGVGLLLAWLSVKSAPPIPPAPAAPYDSVKQPLDMCRPVYRGA